MHNRAERGDADIVHRSRTPKPVFMKAKKMSRRSVLGVGEMSGIYARSAVRVKPKKDESQVVGESTPSGV